MTIPLGSLTLRNPICVSAGPTGCGDDLPSDQWDFAGAYFTQGITLHPRSGNSGERLFDAPAGLINRVGLENVGLSAFMTNVLPNLQNKKTPIIVNVVGFSIDEWANMMVWLNQNSNIAGIELNVSCPNVDGGYPCKTPFNLEALVATCKSHSPNKPLIVKLSAAMDISEMVKAAEVGGADVISLTNTIPALTENGLVGGLSGPAIKPIALKAVADARKVTKLPIIGMGGISKPKDVDEFLNAGANAVAVGSALLTEPTIIERLVKSYVQDN